MILFISELCRNLKSQCSSLFDPQEAPPDFLYVPKSIVQMGLEGSYAACVGSFLARVWDLYWSFSLSVRE